MSIIAIDFEASCLPVHGRSFPIEVGISADGHTAQSWLIQPAPEWVGWSWTEEAESLHGISQAQLMREGLPAAQVLRELCGSVGRGRLVADSDLDGRWLRTLADAAGAPLALKIDHVSLVLDAFSHDAADIEAAIACADRRVARRHRAGEDARWLATVIACLGNAGPHRPAASPFPWTGAVPADAPPMLVSA